MYVLTQTFQKALTKVYKVQELTKSCFYYDQQIIRRRKTKYQLETTSG